MEFPNEGSMQIWKKYIQSEVSLFASLFRRKNERREKRGLVERKFMWEYVWKFRSLFVQKGSLKGKDFQRFDCKFILKEGRTEERMNF